MTTKALSYINNATCQTDARIAAQTDAKTETTHRTWLWVFLALVAASQLYFVRELAAAFALFAIAFVAIAFVVASLYMLTKAGELALSRIAELRQPVLNVAAVPSQQRKAA